MYALRCLALLLCVALSILSPLDARKIKRNSQSDDECLTNTECLRKGLPLLPPRRAPRQYGRRQNQAFVPVSTTTCGSPSTVFLPVGSYQVSLTGASGSGNSRGSLPGGRGAVVTTTLAIGNNITVGYFVGCPGGTHPSGTGVGGGGGGSFIYIIGPNEPAVLVAGGGGGAGITVNGPGRNGGTNPDGTATLKDGAPGAQNGAGGVRPVDSDAGAAGSGGGGFISAGGNTDRSTGGSQSINYNGDFSGGTTQSGATRARTGGAGGGGGAGFFGGSGGGGYSGGGGGDGEPTSSLGGGGGGGSYVNPGTPGGITASAATLAVATGTGQGSLVITKLS